MPIISALLFIIIGIFVGLFKSNILYFYLFSGIGLADYLTRFLTIRLPKYRHYFRLIVQFFVALFFVAWLAMVIGVNFQFSEIFFDAYAGIITGALIQLVVARLVLPFILGNSFCSHACWTGFIFEMLRRKDTKEVKIYKRSEFLAWTYMLILAVFSITIASINNPATDEGLRKIWILADNLFIILLGLVLTTAVGSRAYCRLLCPFITISSVIAPFSLFKITPVNAISCNNCKRCNDVCPMLIDVNSYVLKNNQIKDKMCLQCERCVSVCKKNVLELKNK